MRHYESCANALPLSDHLFKKPLYVTHGGWERVSPNQKYPGPGHPSCYGYTWEEGRVLGEFCLAFITGGEGEIETNLGIQPIHAGQAYLYYPGEWHRHRPNPAVGWFNTWINFNGSLPHQWLSEQAFIRNKNLISPADPGLFELQFKRLVESVNSIGSKNSLVLSWQAIGLISHFLTDTGAPEASDETGSGDTLVDSVMTYIWSQSHNQIGVPDIARATKTNRRTLERRFKDVTGKSLFQEIQHCRISRAALLLRETEAPIKYVIGRAGFASYQQMRVAFHTHLGCSPEGYRELHGSAGQDTAKPAEGSRHSKRSLR